MFTQEQNNTLCRVEGDAPMGQLMRRHWLPACCLRKSLSLIAHLKTRLLGDTLVVFRDTEGKLGVLEDRCPHRKASLSFGRNEECGLRCLYHGWKFAVDGTVLDMASEPNSERKQQSFKHKAYPVRESGGFVWVYLGDEATMTDFQPPAWAPRRIFP